MKELRLDPTTRKRVLRVANGWGNLRYDRRHISLLRDCPLGILYEIFFVPGVGYFELTTLKRYDTGGGAQFPCIWHKEKHQTRSFATAQWCRQCGFNNEEEALADLDTRYPVTGTIYGHTFKEVFICNNVL